MTQTAPGIRANVTLSGVFFGSLLDETFHLTHAELLVVTVDALVLSDGTQIPITPVQSLLEFDPTQTPLGMLWRIGDAFQVFGRLHVTHRYPGRVRYAQLSHLRQTTVQNLARSTRTWLKQISSPAARAMLSRPLNRFIRGDLTFAQFQDRLWNQSSNLSPAIREGLRKIQRRQVALMRALNTKMGPDTFVITHPTTLSVLRLGTSGEIATRIDRDRSADATYRHKLLVSIRSHERLLTPGSPPSVHLPDAHSDHSRPKRGKGRPEPVLLSLTVIVHQATPLHLVPILGPLAPVDTLAATVTAFDLPPQAADGSSAAFNRRFATFLVYDSALARLQLTPGWQGVLTGSLTQERIVAPEREEALARAQQQVLHRVRQLLDQSLAASGDVVLPIYARLSAQLATGKLSFEDYRQRLASLRPAADPPLAAKQTAVWRAFTQKHRALTRPAWLLTAVTDQITEDGGAMLPMLVIDDAQLADAAYRHQLFEQWQQNAAKAAEPLDPGPAD